MIKVLPDRDKWRNWYLDEDVEATLSNGDILVIRKGFRFDAHSVPFLLRWLFKQYSDRDIVAALVHDYLIATQPWHRYSREFIDQQYRYFMEAYSYGKRRDWMPLAVILHGFLTVSLWGDDRGEPKPGTTIEVEVTTNTFASMLNNRSKS